eukprot:UN26812
MSAKEAKEKYAALAESCLWPLTECMKNQQLREQVMLDDKGIRVLMELVDFEHTGTRTNLFALLIRLVKHQGGLLKKRLLKIGLLDKLNTLENQNPVFHAQAPDWLRNLSTLKKILLDNKPSRIRSHPNNNFSPDNNKKHFSEPSVYDNNSSSSSIIKKTSVHTPLPTPNDIDSLEKNLAVMGVQCNREHARDTIIKARSMKHNPSADDIVNIYMETQPSPRLFAAASERQDGASSPMSKNENVDKSQYLKFVGLESDPFVLNIHQKYEDNVPVALDFAEEENSITASFRNDYNQNKVYNVEWAFDVLDLRNLFKVKCHILHLSGHGITEQLIVEDGYGATKVIQKEELKKFLINSNSVDLKLLFVSMCNSENVAAKFLEMGVEHVVAVDNSKKVKDRVAIQFAEHFYGHLFSGETIQKSFDTKNFCTMEFDDKKIPMVLLPEKGNSKNIHHEHTLDDLFGPLVKELTNTDESKSVCKEIFINQPIPHNEIPKV